MLLNVWNHFPTPVAFGEARGRRKTGRERTLISLTDGVSDEVAEIKGLRKLRLLGLHGFRTSAEIMKKQLTSKWPECVLEKLDLVFVDAPFPCEGKSSVEGLFGPPYYEWFQFTGCMAHKNFEECLAYVEDCMIKHGPFDGLIGFSQGAVLAAILAGMQANGAALTGVAKIKLVVIIGGAKLGNPSVIETAYCSPIRCQSIHFLGDRDFLKKLGTELIETFVEPLVIRHPNGHTIPKLDDGGLKNMLASLERVQKDVEDEKQENSLKDDAMEL